MVDRVIVYDAALPQSTDVLNTNMFTMMGLGYALRAILGTSTVVNGLACTPSTPTANLFANVGVGSIYMVDQIDASAYGDLGINTNTVVKQGIVASPTVFNFSANVAALSVGFSQNVLIQATLSDVDAGSTVLPYFNANNPSQPFSGPANAGTSNFTTRTCVCTLALKAGTQATTGTQTTPSADSGYVGLFVITLTNGMTQITSGQIAQLNTAPFFPTLPAVPTDVQDNLWTYAADTSAGGTATATNNTTSTSSAVLHFASVPGWITNGMTAYDITTPTAITGSQTVIGTTSNTVTLSANVNANVGNGDLIAFSNNALVASVSPIPTLTAGLQVKIKAAGTNSGAATLNLNGLGAVAIKRATGVALAAGDITANMVASLIYDGSSFQIENFEGFSGSMTVTNNIVAVPYGNDTGSTNAIVVSPTPTIPSLAAGQLLLVKMGHTNTGATTCTVAALGAVNVTDALGGALVAGALQSGQMALLEYDGTEFQLTNAYPKATGTLFNVQQFQTSTRVNMTGNSGNSYTVTPWSPGSYVKQSATSRLIIWASLSNFTTTVYNSGPGQGVLAVGASNLVFIPSNNNASLSFGNGNVLQILSGISAGSLALSVSFSRTDSTIWNNTFCFNNTDASSYPASTTSTIVIAELGP